MRRDLALLLLLASCLSVPAAAQAPKLGSISFPTSGSSKAQPHFVLGVLYLHSFEYDDAAKEFQEAERLEPASRWRTGARP